MPYCVYVLESEKDGANYVGYTKDIKRRLVEHNTGKSPATSPRKPFRLIYCEVYLNSSDAKARERFLKTGWGKNYLKRTLRYYYRS